MSKSIWEGIGATVSNLEKLSSSAQRELESAVNKAAAVVQGSAKRNCPVDTGNLRDSLHIRPATTHGSEVTAEVYDAVEYAPYVEFGTGSRGGYKYPTKEPITYKKDWPGQVAQPFLGKALYDNEKNIEKIINSALKGSMR